jgi:IclR family transcriptional regulator, KDG regulon repressor
MTLSPVAGRAHAPRSTPAVNRAFAILGLIRTSGPLSVREAAAQLGLPRSSVHELMHTLAALGAVAPADGASGRFTLGLLLHELGSAYLSQVDVAREGMQAVEAVAAACGETVHLATLDGVEVVYLAKVDSIHAVRMVSAVGRRLPAHCTGVGKALLSGLPDEEVVRRYGGGDAALPAMTPRSIPTVAALLDALVEVRRLGCSVDDCESNRDVRCVAAPVHDHRGTMVAAMSISVPISRTAEDWPGRLADLVRVGAGELSRRLGGLGDLGP